MNTWVIFKSLKPKLPSKERFYSLFAGQKKIIDKDYEHVFINKFGMHLKWKTMKEYHDFPQITSKSIVRRLIRLMWLHLVYQNFQSCYFRISFRTILLHMSPEVSRITHSFPDLLNQEKFSRIFNILKYLFSSKN